MIGTAVAFGTIAALDRTGDRGRSVGDKLTGVLVAIAELGILAAFGGIAAVQTFAETGEMTEKIENHQVKTLQDHCSD